MATYTTLLFEGKLPDYLADVNKHAEEMLFQFVKQMANNEGVDEAMKRRDQLGWVQRMNDIRSHMEEIDNDTIIIMNIASVFSFCISFLKTVCCLP